MVMTKYLATWESPRSVSREEGLAGPGMAIAIVHSDYINYELDGEASLKAGYEIKQVVELKSSNYQTGTVIYHDVEDLQLFAG